MYGLKFTGKIEIIEGVTTLVENTWEVQTEPEIFLIEGQTSHVVTFFLSLTRRMITK